MNAWKRSSDSTRASAVSASTPSQSVGAFGQRTQPLLACRSPMLEQAKNRTSVEAQPVQVKCPCAAQQMPSSARNESPHMTQSSRDVPPAAAASFISTLP
eukprot:scaffold1316_cov130-Isochrysis_galbana.AAC.1